MRAVKSILRWFLGLQAVGLLVLSVAVALGTLTMHRRSLPAHTAIAHAHPLAGIVLAYGLTALVIALGPIYAMAWWTTRNPAARLSAWALAASALNVALGVFLGWASYYAPRVHMKVSPVDGLWCLAFGLAGLVVFSRRELPPDPALAKPKAASVAGDRTSIWTRHAVAALSTVAQIAVLIFWSRLALTQHLLRHHGLSWIVLVTAACIVTTVIHECGHAILAWCFEMKLLSFKAGPFQWASREGKWAFKFHAAGLVTPGGSISAAPTRPDQAAWEFIVMIAAGPGANLLIGAAAVWAVLYDRWGNYQQTWEFIAYTGAFCLIGAVLNLIPFLSEEGSYSDGARILQILTRSPLLAASRALAPAAVAIATPEPLSVVPPAFALAPIAAAALEPAPTSVAVTPPPTVPAPSLPQIAVAVAVPSPPPLVPARPTLTPGTVRPVDTVPLAVSTVEPGPAEPAPEPVQTALAVIPVEAAASKPAPDTDDLLAARFASFLARPTPAPPAITPVAVAAPNPLAGGSPTPDLSPESSSTGLIASATRIPASALNTTPLPPPIRLAAASESATVSAPTAPTGPKAPAVPAAFARRSRPTPLPNSGSPGIEEILAEAASALDVSPLDVPLEVEEPVVAAPYASAIMPPTPSPAAPPSATVPETAPVGPTFSEGWPSRPTFTPLDSAPSESQVPAPVVFAPTSRLLTLADDPAIEESPLPPPQPEIPRFDAFSFLRAAAIENISANPG